jgi:predicted ArsR family transcriptional regulator
MNDRTRRLLQLLSEPVAATVLSACAERDRTNKELEEMTGAKKTLVKQKVELLEVYGLLRAGPFLQQPTGRPAATWRAASVEELRTFEGQVNDFARAMARSIERMVDEPSSSTRLRVVGDPR